MLVLYFSFALVCLYSVLGHPTSKRTDSDDVWETLYEGHNAYESEMDHDHPGLREDLATNGQHPNFMVIACSDSRVAPETVFSALPGTVFSERVVANQFDPEDLPENVPIFYSIEHLQAHHVVVMGHYGCGGVAAAIASPPPEPMSDADKGIQKWVRPIRETLASSDREEIVEFRKSHAGNETIGEPQLHDPAFRALVEENVKKNVLNVADSDFMERHWANSTNPPVFVYGLVYDIENGEIFDLNVTMGPTGVSPPSSRFPIRSS